MVLFCCLPCVVVSIVDHRYGVVMDMVPPSPSRFRPLQMDSEDEEGGDGGSDDVDSDDELLAGLDADPEVRNFWGGVLPGDGGVVHRRVF